MHTHLHYHYHSQTATTTPAPTHTPTHPHQPRPRCRPRAPPPNYTHRPPRCMAAVRRRLAHLCWHRPYCLFITLLPSWAAATAAAAKPSPTTSSSPSSCQTWSLPQPAPSRSSISCEGTFSPLPTCIIHPACDSSPVRVPLRLLRHDAAPLTPAAVTTGR